MKRSVCATSIAEREREDNMKNHARIAVIAMLAMAFFFSATLL